MVRSGPVRSKLGAITDWVCLLVQFLYEKFSTTARTHSRAAYFLACHHITLGLISRCVCLLHSCTRQGEIITGLLQKTDDSLFLSSFDIEAADTSFEEVDRRHERRAVAVILVHLDQVRVHVTTPSAVARWRAPPRCASATLLLVLA